MESLAAENPKNARMYLRTTNNVSYCVHACFSSSFYNSQDCQENYLFGLQNELVKKSISLQGTRRVKHRLFIRRRSNYKKMWLSSTVTPHATSTNSRTTLDPLFPETTSEPGLSIWLTTNNLEAISANWLSPFARPSPLDKKTHSSSAQQELFPTLSLTA